MEFSLKEKRGFPRLRLKMPLSYQIRGFPEYNNALSEDISESGIGFQNEDFLSPGTLLDLKIDILSRVLNSVGRVSWSQPLPHSNRYRVGVEFVEFDRGVRNYLEDYLNTLRTNIL